MLPKGLLARLSRAAWVDLDRAATPQKVVVKLSSGEVYMLDVDATLWMLNSLGVYEPESILDFVWNFKETTLNLWRGTVHATYELNRGMKEA